MKPTTDIEQVKSVARALLMTEVYKTPYSPMVVQHPFTSSGFVATTKDGVMQLIDITESEENLQAWQSFMRKQIPLLIAGLKETHMTGANWGRIMAASTLSIVPIAIVYLACQKYFVQGIATTGMK